MRGVGAVTEGTWHAACVVQPPAWPHLPSSSVVTTCPGGVRLPSSGGVALPGHGGAAGHSSAGERPARGTLPANPSRSGGALRPACVLEDECRRHFEPLLDFPECGEECARFAQAHLHQPAR